MQINKSTTVGQIVANEFQTAKIFEKYNIDFCCKGHIHLEETCESLNPEMQSFWIVSEDNLTTKKADFPEGAFLRNVYCEQLVSGSIIKKEKCKAWMAVLIREGEIQGFIENFFISYATPNHIRCFFINKLCAIIRINIRVYEECF